MNADEIVKVLRKCGGGKRACEKCKYNIEPDEIECRISAMREAANEINHLKAEIFGQADLIESLQAQLAAKDAEIARMTADREALFDQLRRADLDCDLCKHNIAEDCNNPDPDCETCHLDCACKGCTDNSKWEWRGSEDVICD